MTRQHFKLDRPPLIFVLVQVVISPITKIEKYVPDIQDQLRRHGFPLFEKRSINQVKFSLPEKELETQTINMYRFGNASNDTIIILNEQGCVLQTSNYSNYESTMKMMAGVLATVHEILNIDLAMRLGIRYVNLIRVSYADAGTYLHPSMLGLPPDSLGDSLTAVERSMVLVDKDDEARTLVTRVQQVKNGAFLPSGLDPFGLQFDERLRPQQDEEVVILDLDHYREQQQPFEPDTVIQEFSILHDRVEQRFHAVTTSEARKRWGFRSVEGGE